MIELFERQVEKCKTANELNRLHIALENRITPLECVALWKIIWERYSTSQNVSWIKKLNIQMTVSGKSQVEQYIRTRLKPNMYFYSDQSSLPDKTLLVCFTGYARRLMMPTPAFLQHLSSSRVDAIVLQRHHNWNYYNGLGGLSNSFEGLIEVIGNAIRRTKYKRIVTYGTSSGGLPAILSALYLGLHKGVAIGCGSLESERWRLIKDSDGFKQAVARHRGKPRLVSVFGAERKRDAAAAAGLSKHFTTELLAIPGATEHVAINKYWRSGELCDFFSTMFLT